MSRPKTPVGVRTEITNSDLFLFALYRLGGAGQYVDVEDVFIEMWKMAPERFSWRKYEYPHYKIAHDALSDITKPRKHQSDLLLRGADGLSRQLTAKGVTWVEHRLYLLTPFARGEVQAPPDRRPSQKSVVYLERDPKVQSFLNGEQVTLELHEAAVLLRCAPDSPTSAWRERWETARSAAIDSHRGGLVRFLDWLRDAHPRWFEVKS